MATASRKTLLVVFLCGLIYGEIQVTLTLSVGKGYYLPNKDVLSDLTDGYGVFRASRFAQCIVTSDNPKASSGFTDYGESKADFFFKSVATQTGLLADLISYSQRKFTFATTYKAKSKQETFDAAGVTIYYSSFNKAMTLKQDCMVNHPLDNRLEEAFRDLPKDIGDPKLEKSWKAYKEFLEFYGSHIVRLEETGAELNQWTFAKLGKDRTYRSYTRFKNQLYARACAEFGKVVQTGVNPPGLLDKIDICRGITMDKMKASAKLDMQSHFEARGGRARERNAFRDQRTYNNMMNFIKTADYGSPGVAINYKFKPIWDVLSIKFYNDPSHAIRIRNMKNYYNGYKGCEYVVADDGEVLQRYEKIEDFNPDKPKYECFSKLNNSGQVFPSKMMTILLVTLCLWFFI